MNLDRDEYLSSQDKKVIIFVEISVSCRSLDRDAMSMILSVALLESVLLDRDRIIAQEIASQIIGKQILIWLTEGLEIDGDIADRAFFVLYNKPESADSVLSVVIVSYKSLSCVIMSKFYSIAISLFS